MNRLRVKISALLAVAIFLIVCVITYLLAVIGRPPHNDREAEIAAAQIVLLNNLINPNGPKLGPDLAGRFGVRDAPEGGKPIEPAQRDLAEELWQLGVERPVQVTAAGPDRWPVASLDLGDGRFLVAPIASHPAPPPSLFGLLLAWVAAVTLGATAVVVFVVFRITKPLVMLERAVADMGPNGEMAALPEVGPQEVQVTARAVNRLSSRLRSAMESRMRLVAAAGHDLRTPMTRMRLRAEFLPDGDRERWLADLDELDRIADSAIRLVQEETVGASGEPMRFDLLVGGVAEELVEIGHAVTIATLEPATIVAGQLSLRRAIRNLMVNAATHGGGATVTLTVRDARAELTIRDQGPGIPDALMQRVFEPFFRVDPARKSSIPGAGLGLAIAREIVGRSGGVLELQNAPDGGLRQTVSFPATGRRGEPLAEAAE